MKKGTAAIQFEYVDFHVEDKTILKNITGEFATGKVTTLLGPSGSGKTTLLKLCNGLISPSQGSITVLEKAIDTYEPTDLRQKVGIALQQSPMIKGTVYDNLNLAFQLQGNSLTKERAIKMLEEVGLEQDILHQNSKDVSGGQKQRISIARTLLNEPKILLLDEITSSLDQEATSQVEQTIQQINKKYGVTIIWITHQLEQAEKIGDDMWLLDDGQLIESGSIELLQDTSNKKVNQFVQGTLS